MSDRDNYEILGLTSDADGTVVNRTYWHLARKYQALAPTDPRARHMLDELNDAYAVLGTPQLREAYDASRQANHATSPVEPSRASHGHGPARPNRAKASVLDETAPHSTRTRALLRIWAPYAAVALLAATSVGIGALAGNAVLLVAGTCGVLALVATAARHNFRHVRAFAGARRVAPGTRAEAQPASRIRERDIPRLPSASFTGRRAAPVEDLHSSTASMVGRWRTSVNARDADAGGRKPDTTLVDIFQSERDVETPSEPLAAVLDILRGSRDPVELR